MVSLNKLSEHPLAEAIVKCGKEQGVEFLKADGFKAVIGKGVEAKINGKKVALGNDKMMEYAGAAIPEKHINEIQSYQKQGKTVSLLSIDGDSVGYVVIGDKIKKTSAKAITSLQNKGISSNYAHRRQSQYCTGGS